MRFFITLSLILFSLTLSAQDWLKKAATKAAGDASANQRAKLDSVDFQFAISVNENSGFLDVGQENELASKGGYMLFREQKDKTKTDLAREILDRAIFYNKKSAFGMAEFEFNNAKTYMESNSLTGDVIYLRCISAMALVYLSQSKFQQAEEFIERSLSSAENSRGVNSAAYVSNMNSKAKLLQQQGRYNEAEKVFDQAIENCRKRFGAESLEYAILRNNLAVLLQTMGRFDEAITEMNESVVVAQKALQESKNIIPKGKKSFESRQFLSNLAGVYQAAGQYDEAEKIYLQIKSVYETALFNKGTPEYANVLNQLGILYIQMDKPDKVEALLKTSADVYKKKFTEQHPSFAKVTADLGNFYRMQARNAEAETLLNKALKIRESTLGNNHPDYARSQEDLAILYWKTGRLDNAYSLYREVMDKTIDFINQYFPPMSEAEKTKYWDITAPRFQRFFNFAIEAHIEHNSALQDFYDYYIATKAILLNATNKVKETILKGSDENLKKDYLQWLDQKEQLARLYAYSKEELTEQKIDLADLERKANAMERSLSERSSDFSAGYSTTKISYKQILSLLTDTEAVVDIVRVRKFDQDFTSESRYVALVLKKGLEMPRLVMLENGNQLETRYAKFYRNAIHEKMADNYSYEQYWSKIEQEVATKKMIYLSPDGVYNQLNLNTLKKPDGNYVLNRYDLVIIGNSKDLLALKAKKAGAPKKNAFLLGFPDYATKDISSLPGTKTEVDAVARLLKTSGYQVTQVMEKQATEANVKKLNGPSLVHIATHGYFLQDVDDAGGSSVFGVNAENASNNPLLRSGLILAGAGHAISGGGTDISSNDNGVLTAYEAMNLNLEGTDLVVLSACETGLGDVKSGEGVYGLQRAFLVAGADAMIMSLWKVDDAATQQLMTSFYTNWLKLGNKQRAFKQAQLQLMTKYKEPYYWGAFVMMGM
ncbi:MAG: CHAT domain-containing protein [Cyclobacteriaceae bacterium]|nr:CHAT domain-containing protein [Cyclobacteriaceae bacterium]